MCVVESGGRKSKGVGGVSEVVRGMGEGQVVSDGRGYWRMGERVRMMGVEGEVRKGT